MTETRDEHPGTPGDHTSQRVKAGLKWVTASIGATRLLQFLTVIIVARVLGPPLVGLVALATAAVMFIGAIRRNGIGQAFVHIELAGEDQIRRAANTTFAFVLTTNVLLMVVGYASVDWLVTLFQHSKHFDAELFPPVLRALLWIFLIDAFAATPELVLQRRLEFRTLSVAEVCTSFTQSALTISCVFAGLGVWAIVIGQIAGQCVRATLLTLKAGWRPSLRGSMELAGRLLAFGKYMWVFATLSAASSQLDKIVIGALIGAGAPVAFYERAFRLCQMPAMSVAELSNRLSFPAFSRSQKDPEFVRRGFFRSIRHVALAVIPMAVGLAAVSDCFIVVILGSEWVESADVVRVLAFYGANLAISSTMGPVLMGLGKPNVLMWNSVLYQAVLFAGLLLLYPLGIVGIAFAVLIPSVAASIAALVVIVRLLDTTAWTIVGPIARTLLCSLPMLASVLAFRATAPTPNRATELFASIALGVLVYWITSITLNRTQVDELKNTVQKTMSAR